MNIEEQTPSNFNFSDQLPRCLRNEAELLFAGVGIKCDANNCGQGTNYPALETSFNEMKEAMLRDSSQSSFEPAPTDVNGYSA